MYNFVLVFTSLYKKLIKAKLNLYLFSLHHVRFTYHITWNFKEIHAIMYKRVHAYIKIFR